MYYSEARSQALKAAKINPEKRISLYRCSKCGKGHPLKEVQVDHITAMGTLTYGNLSEWVIGLMFGDQVVTCRPCHSRKSAKENRKRAEKNKKEGANDVRKI